MTWKVGFSDGSGPEYITDKEDKPIAKVRWGCSCCENTSPLTEEEKANIQRMAAANDLLDACKLALKSWFSGEISEIAMETTLLTAVAKAEGRYAGRQG